MGFQLPISIAAAVKKIQSGDLVLPAIQREFVWEEPQIVRLFDSILRGYPIGSFLSWQVQPVTANAFRFYGFMRNFHEKDAPYCPVLDLPPGQVVTAVLDGQQRLTALNIGLRGSYAARLRGGWWNNPKAFPTKRLYVDVLKEAPENELGMQYNFQLLTEAQAQPPEDGSAHWFPVWKLFELHEPSDVMAELASRELGNNKYAAGLAFKLHSAIHNVGTLYFYEETDQDVEKVLDIFIRVNSGGTTLSYSDLLLSIATAQWGERDAREEIRSLLDALNASGQGFRFPKDTVLKTGLVLTGVGDIGFKVRNFNQKNMALLEERWEEVSNALTLATDLLADFGLSEASLTANSVLIPVAYYVYQRGLDETYRTAPRERQDRGALRQWVLRSLIKQGIWGSGLDTLLRDLRDVITEHGSDGFPVAQIEERMAARGKSLTLTPQEIDDLLNLKYGTRRTFASLAMLFPHVDTRNIHHVDHVVSRSRLSLPALRRAGLSDDQAESVSSRRDLLPNLQLLEGPENVAKKDDDPLEWARATYPDGSFEAYLDRNSLPGLPHDPAELDEWFDRRRDLLRSRFTTMLRSVP